MLDSTNNLISEPHRIASTFNDYFTSVFTHENTDTLPQVEPMLDPSDEIVDIEFSEEDVDTLLTKLKDNKSPGVDNTSYHAEESPLRTKKTSVPVV